MYFKVNEYYRNNRTNKVFKCTRLYTLGRAYKINRAVFSREGKNMDWPTMFTSHYWTHIPNHVPKEKTKPKLFRPWK